MVPGEIDVVGDGHQRALGDVVADAAGGVGDDKGEAAEQAEDPGWEGDLRPERVALVGVDAALALRRLGTPAMLPRGLVFRSGRLRWRCGQLGMSA